jgi:hypothetical protein
MFPIFFKFFALLLYLLPMSASAIPITTSTGFIDNQGRDWIRLGDTSGGNFNWHDIANICDPVSGACSGSVSILRTSWQLLDLTGYQWALRTEVNDLFESFLGPVPLANGSYSVDFDSAQELMSEIGLTLGKEVGSGWWHIANGFTRDALMQSAVSIIGGGESPGSAWVHHWGNQGDVYGDVSYGIWAYRPVNLPEPSILALMVLGLAAIGFVRRRTA